jgi:hypothetical protein
MKAHRDGNVCAFVLTSELLMHTTGTEGYTKLVLIAANNTNKTSAQTCEVGCHLMKSPSLHMAKKLRGFIVSERTIPTERPPHVGEVSANFCR